MTTINDGLAHLDADKVQATVEIWNQTRETNEQVKRYVEYAHGDVRFAVWLYLCDKSCMARVEVSIFDLADALWRDKFDSGTTPRDAVQEALEDDDVYGGLMAELDGE